MKLLSMIDFVLNKEQARTEDEYFKEGFYSDCNARILSQIFNYATFLNQHLNLGMFVPAIEVDGNWEVLEPTVWNLTKWTNWEMNTDDEIRRAKQYQQAKDRVLFEGFELTKVDDLGYYDLRNEAAIIEVYNPLDAETEFLDILDNGLYKINDLIKYAPTLTAKGQQLRGLK